MTQPIIDETFQQVVDFVTQTNQSVFLTGKAGTGKTTLLKYLKQHCLKQMAVVAPTGVAAVNAGGTTIHSLFQLPFQPFLPEHARHLLQTLKYQRNRLTLLRQLELLIIDEVSMVRADVLDAIDAVLRSVRRRHTEAFGGVQLLLIGDMFQLPPVVKNEELDILSTVYPSPFFFDARVLQEHRPVYIELTKVFRQTDQTFIDLLNKVRNNQMDEQAITLLNSRYKPDMTQAELERSITLTTHNHKADAINQNALASLKGKVFQFKANVNGSFPERNYPVDENLSLKVGARVMFVKNDTEKRYFNGKIGVVTSITDKEIQVRAEGDKYDIKVEKELWENVSYKVNKSTNQIEEDKLGDFLQYPLRLAWAITIHKSQGLTFDEVIIDAQEAFSAGQVYVALSRCRSLQGLTLKTPVQNRALMNDRNVLSFSESGSRQGNVKTTFQQAKKQYLGRILINLFQFSELAEQHSELKGYMDLFRKHLPPAAFTWQEQFANHIEALTNTAVKFKPQLEQLIANAADPEQDFPLQDRIKKAAVYFEEQLADLVKHIKNHSLLTESKLAHQDITPALNTLYDEAFTKHYLLSSCTQGFNLQTYLGTRLKLVLPSVRLTVYATARQEILTNVSHPALLRALMLVRDEIVEETGMPIYMIAKKETLEEMAEFLPLKHGDLLMIKGFGKARADAYGERFLQLVRNYCNETGLSSNMEAKNPAIKKKEKKGKEKSVKSEAKTKEEKIPKPNTKQLSYDLYKQLKSIEAVAKERGFSISTIEGHLAHFIKSGELDIQDIVAPDRIKRIESVLGKVNPEEGLAPVMGLLPAGYGYGEVRMVQANLARFSESGEKS
ncbi:MAG: AAA family ATPase [Sediminibacterium sp.]|nr:AAA family ATPase [Sediminibacterium sp.]